MAIKGLSDQVRLPRLGKIRLGVRVKGRGNSCCPRAVDYFVCPEPVRRVYGDRPKELRILFPIEDESKWAAQFYRCYSRSRGLVCRGNGQRASALVYERTGLLATRSSRRTTLKEIACHPPTCPHYGERCRRVMNLQFLLPDVPGLGVWQLDTSSYWSMVNINSGLKIVHQVCGRVSMIPLRLKLVAQEVRPNGSKKAAYVLALGTPLTLTQMRRYARGTAGSGGLRG
ncbi:MAG: hypothetical protein FJ012_10070 [Chloroflexi bacterium]|nr:hypothetical protein [Chloroflexota bacterium]